MYIIERLITTRLLYVHNRA